MTAFKRPTTAVKRPMTAFRRPMTAVERPTTAVECPLNARLRASTGSFVPQRVSVSCTAIGFTCVASPFFFTAAASASGVPVRTGKVP